MPKTISRADFFKKVKPVATGLGLLAIGGSVLSGCASTLVENLSKTPNQKGLDKEVEYAMKVLNIQHRSEMGCINGYHMSRIMEKQIRARTETYTNEYIQEQGMNPEDKDYVYQGILREMLETADEDGKEEGIIDFHEGWKILRLEKDSWIYVN